MCLFFSLFICKFILFYRDFLSKNIDICFIIEWGRNLDDNCMFF